MTKTPREREIKRFLQKEPISTLKLYKDSLSAYNQGLGESIKLDERFPIFLDTNVLLRIYSISFAARERLKNFFKDYKVRIYLTNQVQKEFIKNREEVINKFFDNVTQELPEAFQKNILHKIDGFLTHNKIVLKDYQKIEAGLQRIKKTCEELFDTLNVEVESNKEHSKSIVSNDDVLDILIETNNLPSLNEEDLKEIKNDYTTLTKGFNKENVDKELKKAGKAFPGLSDLQRKPDDPYGDFIIFHEVINFMQENQTDAIFLTYDTTKGDWMQFNKLPHLHFIERVFAITGKTIYILDAERVLEDLLDISLKSLIPNQEENLTNKLELIDNENLINFLDSYHLTKNRPKPDPQKITAFVRELYLNRVLFLEDLQNTLVSFEKELEKYNVEKLGQVGFLRMVLTESTKKYHTFTKEGIPKILDLNYLKKNPGL